MQTFSRKKMFLIKNVRTNDCKPLRSFISASSKDLVLSTVLLVRTETFFGLKVVTWSIFACFTRDLFSGWLLITSCVCVMKGEQCLIPPRASLSQLRNLGRNRTVRLWKVERWVSADGLETWGLMESHRSDFRGFLPASSIPGSTIRRPPAWYRHRWKTGSKKSLLPLAKILEKGWLAFQKHSGNTYPTSPNTKRNKTDRHPFGFSGTKRATDLLCPTQQNQVVIQISSVLTWAESPPQPNSRLSKVMQGSPLTFRIPSSHRARNAQEELSSPSRTKLWGNHLFPPVPWWQQSPAGVWTDTPNQRQWNSAGWYPTSLGRCQWGPAKSWNTHPPRPLAKPRQEDCLPKNED